MTQARDAIFAFLLQTGHLTPSSNVQETELGSYVALRMPNLEVHRIYCSEILYWLASRPNEGVVSDLVQEMFLGDGPQLPSLLERFLHACLSSFDGSAEGFYHGLMLGLVMGLSPKYHIRSSRESGTGRFDLPLEPKQASLPAFHLALKAVQAGCEETLRALAEKALTQTIETQDATDRAERGNQKILHFGFAFCGKNAEVRSSWT